jgi:hypothetical protein
MPFSIWRDSILAELFRAEKRIKQCAKLKKLFAMCSVRPGVTPTLEATFG